MAEYGVVPEGFVAKDLEIVEAELVEDERSDISASVNTKADSLLGQLNGIFGDKIAELWEVGLAIYRARQADSADGEALDNVSAITGAIRLPAAPSSVVVSLNLDPATTVPIGSIVGIGASGSQWETQVALTNGGANQATLTVEVKSSESAPIDGNAYAIDTIVVPVVGWSAKAAFDSLSSEPFALVDLQTLLIEIDGGETQTVVFNTADFVDIGAATAQEVIDAIKADTSGVDGLDVSGFMRLFSSLDGSGSAIQIIGGTGFEPLGLSRELIKGFNPSRAAKIINANNETYDLSSSPTLFIAIDGGSAQTITFVDSDFGVAAKGAIEAIEASLLAAGVDTDTFIIDDGPNPAVTFAFDDDSTIVETSTLRAINHNGTQTAGQMRDLIVTAINSAPTLDVTASPGASSTAINLLNDATGTAGNIAIIEAVADAGFLVTGMAGGVADAPTVATAIQVARAINDALIGGIAYEVEGKVQIESLVVGVNSLIEITGGSANTELGYTLSDPQAGSSGDATLGRDVESDADFRIRRIQLLRISGASTVEAIRAALLNVEGVLQAFVFENTTDAVDGFGRPPHSLEAVVSGGTDVDVAQTIFDTKPIGIATHKVVGPNGFTEVIVDSQGESHSINGSRPDEVAMHIEIDIDVVAADFGAGSQLNGEQEVRAALKALGDTLQIGDRVTILKFECVPIGIAGVDDVTAIKIEDTDPPTNTANIIMLSRELATFSISDIDINVTFV